MTESDPYAAVPPPAETDGPQQRVDPAELEEADHVTLRPEVWEADEDAARGEGD